MSTGNRADLCPSLLCYVAHEQLYTYFRPTPENKTCQICGICLIHIVEQSMIISLQ